jgi:hypothetical protein
MRWLGLLLLGGCLAGLFGPAWAHKPSDSYLRLSIDEAGAVSGQWDIALRDLEVAIGLDGDGDGQITWGEVRARHGEISAYALARLVLKTGDEACTVAAGEQLVDEHTDGAYTVLKFNAACGVHPALLEIGYTLFADIDPSHRGLLSLDALGQTRSAVLDPQAPPARFELANPSRWQTAATFVKEGVWHIWIGLDHILFLLCLLLPAVLVRKAAAWRPVPRFGVAFVDVLKVVTAFTVAHSITLSLAALGVMQLPSALVEASIAASVVLAALNNLWPFFQGRRWVVAFAFGLIHGFGFASVLADLGLPKDALLVSLVAFNVGVEIGQLAIVSVFLPLAWALRSTALYRRVLLIGGSTLIALLAAVWFVERAFGFELLKLGG